MRAAVALALLVISASPATAGQKSHKWWHSERFKTELGLTAQQSGQIENIFQEILPKLRSGYRELKTLEKELSTLIASSSPDESEVVQLVGRVEAARSELNTVRTLMLFRMQRILTPEQRARLKALTDAEEDREDRGRDRRKPHDR